MKSKKVNPLDYHVNQFSNNYYGIIPNGSMGAHAVYGGDSACEDHYNREHIEEVYNNWDGTLYYCGNIKDGEQGYIIIL